MAYVRITQDVWVIQGDYGYGDGWEDIGTSENYREALRELREYRQNAPEYRYRIKFTRERIEKS